MPRLIGYVRFLVSSGEQVESVSWCPGIWSQDEDWDEDTEPAWPQERISAGVLTAGSCWVGGGEGDGPAVWTAGCVALIAVADILQEVWPWEECRSQRGEGVQKKVQGETVWCFGLRWCWAEGGKSSYEQLDSTISNIRKSNVCWCIYHLSWHHVLK